MLGYGASSKPEDVEYELELWRDQLVDFMQEVDPEAEWVVGGNSIGGLLSLMVTQARPEQVRGVVLFNSAGGLTSFRDEELPWYFRPIWIFVRVVLFGGERGREAVAVLVRLEMSACLTALWCGWWMDGWMGGRHSGAWAVREVPHRGERAAGASHRAPAMPSRLWTASTEEYVPVCVPAMRAPDPEPGVRQQDGRGRRARQHPGRSVSHSIGQQQ